MKIAKLTKKLKVLVWWVFQEMGDKMAPEQPLVAPVRGHTVRGDSDYAAAKPLKQRDSSSRTWVPCEVRLTTSDKKGQCVYFFIRGVGGEMSD